MNRGDMATQHWDAIRDALTAILTEDDGLEQGEVVGPLIVSYQSSRIGDDNEIESFNSYVMPLSTTGDTAIGMLTIARAQILAAYTEVD